MPRSLHPVYQPLDPPLVLRSVRDEEDAARFAAFNALNGADQAATCTALLRHHPTARWDDFLLVEDTQTGEVVSTTCLIPWVATFEGVSLDIAMLEMVATHPDYRRLGLVRRQIEQFHRTLAARDDDLSIIEGIPYYYRQFGYAYAGDHWAGDRLAAALIPAAPAPPAVRLQPALAADIPVLVQLYARGMGAAPLHAQRSLEQWRYLLEGAGYPTYLVEPAHDSAQGNAPLGYLCGWRSKSDPSMLLVSESSLPAAGPALALLQLLKLQAKQLWLGWPASGTLVQVGRSLGGRPLLPQSSDQWLVRITDPARLLQKLAPVFARRLAGSPWAGLSDALVINLFRQAYRLDFAGGELTGVAPLGFVDASMGTDGGDLCIPPDAFVRLLFGYRTLEELWDAWPDIVVRASRRHLLATIFPRVEGYLWLPYMHCGHLTPI